MVQDRLAGARRIGKAGGIMESQPTRRIDRFALLYHLVMGLWFLVSVANGMRQSAVADEAGPATMAGTGIGLGVMLLIWFLGGVVFAVARGLARR